MFIGSLGPRLREGLVTWLRRDWLVLLLFVVAVVVMTFPLAFRPGEGLPGWRVDPVTARWDMKGDTLSALWQVWWMGEAVKNGLNPNFTPYLFHPKGLDVTFQPRRWAALGVWLPLRSLLGDIAGYNVSVLLGLLLSAYAAYLLIRILTDNRAAAWIGGAFYAFYPAHLLRVLQQPNTGSIQWIPVFMLVLVVGLRKIAALPQPRRDLSRHGLLAMVLAAVALSLNAYISIKPWLQAALLGALYVPLAALAEGWWRSAAFWKTLGVLAICSLLLVLPVLLPFLLSPGLQRTLGQAATDRATKGTDLMAFVKAAPELPILMPRSLARLRGVSFTRWDKGEAFYLGLTSIALVVAGLVDPVKRYRQRLVWLVMALVFWSVSLGTVLHIDTAGYRDVWTPYRLLQEIPIFKAARTPHRFVLGFSLPWAVLVGYGVAHVWRRLDKRKWLARVLVGCLAVLMLFEIAVMPIPQVPLGVVSPFYYQLRAEGEGGAIIDLPSDTDRKWYMYLQTIHHRPIVEGQMGRMPEGHSDYIEANPLLRAWRSKEPLTCNYDFSQTIGDLQADGFSYVVVHKPDMPKWLLGYFNGVEPIYRDDYIMVFELGDLRAEPRCTSAID